jgi:hypothetical protein
MIDQKLRTHCMLIRVISIPQFAGPDRALDFFEFVPGA